MRQFTVAIVGLGSRGYDTYSAYADKFPQRMKIVAVADIDPVKVEKASRKYCIRDDMRFSSAEELLQRERLADCVFIATQDRDHVSEAMTALERGYDILLEKPISPQLKECLQLEKAVKKYQKLVVVCHVLRYTMFFKTIKKLISDGKIGDVMTIQAIENVGYWHQAHSFIRGNWRNSATTSPMILQKCCHDFDIFTFLTDKKCVGVSSFGSLRYFKSENAPEGCSDRCYNCKYRDSCVYSAYQIYIENDLIGVKSGNRSWPVNVVTDNPTEEIVREALKSSQYGKCVFASDNNVVDHQVVNMLFEDDVTVNFTMSAFTADNSRYLKVMGSTGEIVADQNKNTVTLYPFGGQATEYDISKLTEDLSGHGGGDNEMLTQMFHSIESTTVSTLSTIENSLQSHKIAFAAEHSRLHGGKVVKL